MPYVSPNVVLVGANPKKTGAPNTPNSGNTVSPTVIAKKLTTSSQGTPIVSQSENVTKPKFSGGSGEPASKTVSSTASKNKKKPLVSWASHYLQSIGQSNNAKPKKQVNVLCTSNDTVKQTVNHTNPNKNDQEIKLYLLPRPTSKTVDNKTGSLLPTPILNAGSKPRLDATRGLPPTSPMQSNPNIDSRPYDTTNYWPSQVQTPTNMSMATNVNTDTTWNRPSQLQSRDNLNINYSTQINTWADPSQLQRLTPTSSFDSGAYSPRTWNCLTQLPGTPNNVTDFIPRSDSGTSLIEKSHYLIENIRSNNVTSGDCEPENTHTKATAHTEQSSNSKSRMDYTWLTRAHYANINQQNTVKAKHASLTKDSDKSVKCKVTKSSAKESKKTISESKKYIKKKQINNDVDLNKKNREKDTNKKLVKTLETKDKTNISDNNSFKIPKLYNATKDYIEPKTITTKKYKTDKLREKEKNATQKRSPSPIKPQKKRVHDKKEKNEESTCKKRKLTHSETIEAEQIRNTETRNNPKSNKNIHISNIERKDKSKLSLSSIDQRRTISKRSESSSKSTQYKHCRHEMPNTDADEKIRIIKSVVWPKTSEAKHPRVQAPESDDDWDDTESNFDLRSKIKRKNYDRNDCVNKHIPSKPSILKSKPKKYKKIRLVINVIQEEDTSDDSSSESRDISNSSGLIDESNPDRKLDLSFLDEFNIDEIVSSLKQNQVQDNVHQNITRKTVENNKTSSKSSTNKFVQPIIIKQEIKTDSEDPAKQSEIFKIDELDSSLKHNNTQDKIQQDSTHKTVENDKISSKSTTNKFVQPIIIKREINTELEDPEIQSDTFNIDELLSSLKHHETQDKVQQNFKQKTVENTKTSSVSSTRKFVQPIIIEQEINTESEDSAKQSDIFDIDELVSSLKRNDTQDKIQQDSTHKTVENTKTSSESTTKKFVQPIIIKQEINTESENPAMQSDIRGSRVNTPDNASNSDSSQNDTHKLSSEKIPNELKGNSNTDVIYCQLADKNINITVNNTVAEIAQESIDIHRTAEVIPNMKRGPCEKDNRLDFDQDNLLQNFSLADNNYDKGNASANASTDMICLPSEKSLDIITKKQLDGNFQEKNNNELIVTNKPVEPIYLKELNIIETKKLQVQEKAFKGIAINVRNINLDVGDKAKSVNADKNTFEILQPIKEKTLKGKPANNTSYSTSETEGEEDIDKDDIESKMAAICGLTYEDNNNHRCFEVKLGKDLLDISNKEDVIRTIKQIVEDQLLQDKIKLNTLAITSAITIDDNCMVKIGSDLAKILNIKKLDKTIKEKVYHNNTEPKSLIADVTINNKKVEINSGIVKPLNGKDVAETGNPDVLEKVIEDKTTNTSVISDAAIADNCDLNIIMEKYNNSNVANLEGLTNERIEEKLVKNLLETNAAAITDVIINDNIEVSLNSSKIESSSIRNVGEGKDENLKVLNEKPTTANTSVQSDVTTVDKDNALIDNIDLSDDSADAKSETVLISSVHLDKVLAIKIEDRISNYLKLNLKVVKLIYTGKFSKVFKCEDTKGKNFALKILRYERDRQRLGLKKEEMWNELQNDIPKENLNIVNLVNGFDLDRRWCFLMDYYPMNLGQALDMFSFDMDTVQELAKQLVSAVLVIRSNNIIHSDIKPKHILLNSTYSTLKVCGFDAAYYADEAVDLLPTIGTICYRAPEIILGHSAGYSIDVWAAAVVIYEMAAGAKLFDCKFNTHVLHQHMLLCGRMPPHMITDSRFSWRHFVENGTLFKRLIGPQGQHELYNMYQFNNKINMYNILWQKCNQKWARNRTKQKKTRDRFKLLQMSRLMDKMLVLDPRLRITIEFVYADSFFMSY